MTGIKQSTEHVERPDSETMLRFVMTLIVATMMVAVTAYVLSSALLAPARIGSAHGLGPAMQHVRS